MPATSAPVAMIAAAAVDWLETASVPPPLALMYASAEVSDAELPPNAPPGPPNPFAPGAVPVPFAAAPGPVMPGSMLFGPVPGAAPAPGGGPPKLLRPDPPRPPPPP